jgi:hypothetical protein
LDCAAKVVFLVLIAVAQEPQEGEMRDARILRVFERNTSDVRIFFTTNQFLLSCQIKITHHPLPDVELKFQMQALTKMMERMNSMMGNV